VPVTWMGVRPGACVRFGGDRTPAPPSTAAPPRATRKPRVFLQVQPECGR
jgi:hypothetical protein